MLLCYYRLLLTLYPSASNLSHIRWVNHQLSHVGFVCLLVLCLQLPPPPNQLEIAREEREQKLTTKINVSVREKLKINGNLHKKHESESPPNSELWCVCLFQNFHDGKHRRVKLIRLVTKTKACV